MVKTICFVNNKGGCGKTTTVAAVGQAWANLGKKVLFIDLDSQANLTSIITDTDATNVEWERTLEDAFVGGVDFGLPIKHVSEYIDIVPSDLDLANFDRATSGQATRECLLADLLDTVKQNYDFILIDCPPALGTITINALVAADYMVLISNADGLSYRGMKMVTALHDMVINNKRLNPDLKIIGIVITRYEKNKLSELYLKKIMEDLPNYVIKPIIRKSTKIAQAASFQQSIYELDPDGKATQEYQMLSNNLLMRVLTDKM